MKALSKTTSWLPVISLLWAVGIALISIACSASRMSADWAQPVFWAGFLLLIIPPGLRLTRAETSRQERLALLALLALGYFLIKVLYSPLVFSLNDELQHLRSENNILQTQKLFQPNPTLQVSAYFPGLESLANAVLSVTGLSAFPAGIFLNGAAFFTIPILLFLLFERISHSSFVAGIAGMIYFANPSMLLGYSQFAYESLAVPLFFFAIYLITFRVQNPRQSNSLRLWFAILLILTAVIITHHVTSYVLVIFLSIWTVVAFRKKYPDEKRLEIRELAILALIGGVAWMLATGSDQLILGYLGTPVRRAAIGIMNIFTNSAPPRTFFQGKDGQATTLWLQIPSYISVGLILISLPLGFWGLYTQRKINSLALAMTLMSGGYLLAQLTRISSTALLITDRLASVVFFPLSFVIAFGVVKFLWAPTRPVHLQFLNRLRWPILTFWVSAILIGSATAVLANRQLPGPYNPGIFTRNIGSLGIAAAQWSNEALGPGNRVGADFVNMLLMGSYGNQQVVTEENDFFAETSVFASGQSFGQEQKDYLGNRGIDYLVVDTRLSDDLVLPPQTPEAATYPTRLDGLTTISRIYDSGGIVIYHLGFVSQYHPVQNGSSSQPFVGLSLWNANH